MENKTLTACSYSRVKSPRSCFTVLWSTVFGLASCLLPFLRTETEILLWGPLFVAPWFSYSLCLLCDTSSKNKSFAFIGLLLQSNLPSTATRIRRYHNIVYLVIFILIFLSPCNVFFKRILKWKLNVRVQWQVQWRRLETHLLWYQEDPLGMGKEGPLGPLPANLSSQSAVATSLAQLTSYSSPACSGFPTISRFLLKAHVFSSLNLTLIKHIQKCFLLISFATGRQKVYRL